MSSSAAIDLVKLEAEATVNARKHVANMLQRPDQLEKVDQFRRRLSRKKGSVEAQLKTAVQSQLDGVRTGLNQLHSALQDVRSIKESLKSVDVAYSGIADLGEKLKRAREENVRHSQLGAAMENLKHIFTVPESVTKTQELINEGKLLHAHKCLKDLETSRDELLFELHKQPSQSPTDINTVKHYFGEVERLSDMLAKQLWLIIQRTIITVRREPTIIVSVLRIIEREERNDQSILRKQEQTGFLPPCRPKRWRQKCFETLEEAVQSKIEGSQMEDRSMNKMWLVRHLELIRQTVIEDLRVVKTLCQPCFPPHYDIFNRFVKMYHSAISQHIDEMVSQGLEGNEIVSLLGWIHTYKSPELMGLPELEIDTSSLTPLLENNQMSSLQNQYLQTMKSNFQEWMSNSLKTDVKDWYRDNEPEADDKGFFNTPLPVILFQMIEQNLAVASTIGEELVKKVIILCTDELASFSQTYKAEITDFREKHLQNRSQPKFYLHYVIANINNCQGFIDFTMLMITQKYKQAAEGQGEQGLRSVSDAFNKIAYEGCEILLQEVLLDLDEHIKDLMSRNWLHGSTAADTICITLEDYCQDFVHLKNRFYEYLMVTAQDRVVKEYIKALMSKKIAFKNYEERKMAAEKIVVEAEQFQQLFSQLSLSAQESSPFEALPMLSEIIKLRDTSMMSLEISGLVNKYPDLRGEQIINLLLSRGDLNRSEARQMVTETLGEDDHLKPKPNGIFSQVWSSTSNTK